MRPAIGADLPRQTGSGLETMVLVPAGEFIMGSSEEDLQGIRIPKSVMKSYSDEMPKRRVNLKAFYIDKYPVTNAQFRKFAKPKVESDPKFNGVFQPVVGVTWSQARNYCQSVGKRLPTEAEWEKAARGVDGRRFPWGNQWEGSKVIWWKNSGRKSHPVNRTKNTHQSPHGAVDMAGNVWEWVSDWYKRDYYQSAPDHDPSGPSSGTRRVIRGGSWLPNDIFPRIFRAPNRSSNLPDEVGDWLGFRCAKSP
jgi:iron(II)-dependent oxidoreductase